MAENTASLPQYLDCDDVARVLKLAKSTVYSLIAHKKLGHVRIGRVVRVERSTLEEFLSSRTVGGECEARHEVAS